MRKICVALGMVVTWGILEAVAQEKGTGGAARLPTVNVWKPAGTTPPGLVGLVYSPTIKGFVRWSPDISKGGAVFVFDTASGQWQSVATTEFKKEFVRSAEISNRGIQDACAWDSKRGMVVYAGSMLTCAYEPAEKTWKDYGAQIELWGGKHPGGPPAEYGKAFCYDPVNDELVALSGLMTVGYDDFDKTGGQLQGTLGTVVYSYKDNLWRRVGKELGPKEVVAAREQILDLIVEQTPLIRSGFAAYLAAWNGEKDKGAAESRKLGASQEKLAAKVEALAKTAPDRGRTLLAESAKKLGEAAKLLSDGKSKEGYLVQYAGLEILYRLREEVLLVEPPGRAHSRMIYDAKNKCIALFGGDRQDRTLGDTWVYDCARRQWEQRFPKDSPCPRAGHGFAYDSKRGLCVLWGGQPRGDFGQDGKWDSMAEVWTYDIAGNAWTRYACSVEGSKAGYLSRGEGYIYMDYDPEGDALVAVRANGQTYTSRFDPATAKPLPAQSYAWRNKRPVTVELSEPDPVWVAKVKALPANAWTEAGANRRPWDRGYTASGYDPVLDALLLFGGGHSTHQDNDIEIYFPQANQWVWASAPFGVNVAPWQSDCTHPSGVAMNGGPFCMHMRHQYTGLAGTFYLSDFIRYTDYVYGPEWLRNQPSVRGNSKQNRVFRFDLADRRWRLCRSPRVRESEICGGKEFGAYSQYGTQYAMVKEGKIIGGGGEVIIYDPVADKHEHIKPPSLPSYNHGPDGGESWGQVYCEERNEIFAFGRQGKDGAAETWLCNLAKNEWRNLEPGRSPPPNPDRGGQRACIQLWVPDAGVVLAMVRRGPRQDHPLEWVYSFEKNVWAPLGGATPTGFPGKNPDIWEKLIYSPKLKAFFRASGRGTWALRPDFSQIKWE